MSNNLRNRLIILCKLNPMRYLPIIAKQPFVIKLSFVLMLKFSITQSYCSNFNDTLIKKNQ